MVDAASETCQLTVEWSPPTEVYCGGAVAYNVYRSSAPGFVPGPSNLIAAEIIQQARKSYDITIIDTSKVFPTNRRMVDPVEIAKEVDGIALVVCGNVTPRQQVKRAKIMLETAGANVVGLIFNQQQTQKSH